MHERISVQAHVASKGDVMPKPKKANGGSPFGKLAEWTGLEPATPGVTGRYSNQLNYHSVVREIIGGC